MTKRQSMTPDETVFSINGKIVPEAQAVVPITDRGFLYGDGLFETFHAYGQKILRLDAHLQRLLRGARSLFFDQFPEEANLTEWLNRTVASAGFPEANVRLTVTRGSGSRGPSLRGPYTPTVAIMVTRYQRLPEARFKKGVSAIVTSFRRQESSATASLKTLNYLEQILARREADLAGTDEALMLNNAGLLCEGSASNIALIRDGTVVIPDPVRSGALAGIAQLTALEAAADLKIPVSMACLGPWDLSLAEEAFLTGSLREITPLVRVKGKPVGGGKPGPLTLKLIAGYRRIVERECAPYRFSN